MITEFRLNDVKRRICKFKLSTLGSDLEGKKEVPGDGRKAEEQKSTAVGGKHRKESYDEIKVRSKIVGNFSGNGILKIPGEKTSVAQISLETSVAVAEGR